MLHRTIWIRVIIPTGVSGRRSPRLSGSSGLIQHTRLSTVPTKLRQVSYVQCLAERSLNQTHPSITSTYPGTMSVCPTTIRHPALASRPLTHLVGLCLLFTDMSNRLILFSKVRPLEPFERPLQILRKCLLQFGYTDQDKVDELSGKDNSFLCRFMFAENGDPNVTAPPITVCQTHQLSIIVQWWAKTDDILCATIGSGLSTTYHILERHPDETMFADHPDLLVLEGKGHCAAEYFA